MNEKLEYSDSDSSDFDDELHLEFFQGNNVVVAQYRPRNPACVRQRPAGPIRDEDDGHFNNDSSDSNSDVEIINIGDSDSDLEIINRGISDSDTDVEILELLPGELVALEPNPAGPDPPEPNVRGPNASQRIIAAPNPPQPNPAEPILEESHDLENQPGASQILKASKLKQEEGKSSTPDSKVVMNSQQATGNKARTRSSPYPRMSMESSSLGGPEVANGSMANCHPFRAPLPSEGNPTRNGHARRQIEAGANPEALSRQHACNPNHPVAANGRNMIPLNQRGSSRPTSFLEPSWSYGNPRLRMPGNLRSPLGSVHVGCGRLHPQGILRVPQVQNQVQPPPARFIRPEGYVSPATINFIADFLRYQLVVEYPRYVANVNRPVVERMNEGMNDDATREDDSPSEGNRNGRVNQDDNVQ